MKFIALLRGINVGGNNKVPMADLKDCFEQAGFKNVVTYINSGNVVFDSDQTDPAQLVKVCESAIKQQFGFYVICAVISADDLMDALKHAPEWWNQDPESRHNALFVIAPAKAQELMAQIGETKPDYEQVAAYHPIIFWSAPNSTFNRTRYSKIVGTNAYKSVTIRNANTTNKLAQLCK